MNRQQRQLLIAIAGMLALLLVLLLVISLNRADPNQAAEQPDPWAATVSPAPETTVQPLTEEEMGRQAMSEEEVGEEPEDVEALPVD